MEKLKSDLIEYNRTNKKLNAVKVLIENYEIGLKDAKDLCDVNWGDEPDVLIAYIFHGLKNFKKREVPKLLAPSVTGNDEPKFDFISGEDNSKIVEYYLNDDNGVCTRCSPFLMPKGTEFEHSFGRYRVEKIEKAGGRPTRVICERITTKLTLF